MSEKLALAGAPLPSAAIMGSTANAGFSCSTAGATDAFILGNEVFGDEAGPEIPVAPAPAAAPCALAANLGATTAAGRLGAVAPDLQFSKSRMSSCPD